jgi:hypothetical protein
LVEWVGEARAAPVRQSRPPLWVSRNSMNVGRWVVYGFLFWVPVEAYHFEIVDMENVRSGSGKFDSVPDALARDRNGSLVFKE